MTSKPTPGPWEAQGGGSAPTKRDPEMMECSSLVIAPVAFTENEHGNFERVDDQTVLIAKGRTMEEAQTNARLAAEAGTVHHETGLTPQQLREQRDKLLEACKAEEEANALNEGRAGYEEWQSADNHARELRRAVIASVEGRS